MHPNSSACLVAGCGQFVPPEHRWIEKVRNSWKAVSEFLERMNLAGAAAEKHREEIRRAHEMLVNMNGYRF